MIGGARLGCFVLAAGLSILAAIEILHPGAPAPTVQPIDLAAAHASTPTAPPVARFIATITARPLFRPDRRPVAAVAAQTISLPRLSGILIGAGLRLAIFADAGGKTRMVRQGGAVGAYRVVRITPGSVTLTTSGARVVLSPRFAESDGAGTTTQDQPHPLLRPPMMPPFHTPGKD